MTLDASKLYPPGQLAAECRIFNPPYLFFQSGFSVVQQVVQLQSTLFLCLWQCQQKIGVVGIVGTAKPLGVGSYFVTNLGRHFGSQFTMQMAVNLNANNSWQSEHSKSCYRWCHDLPHDVALSLPHNVPLGLAEDVYRNLWQGDEGLAQKPYQSYQLSLELTKLKVTRI